MKLAKAGELIFESDRLIFRRWQESDRLPFRQMNKDPEVMKYFPNRLTSEASDAFIQRMEKTHREKGFGLYAVELKASGDFIGFIGFAEPRFTADFTPCIEIGWRLDKSYWHKGYATEGARECLAYGFQVLGFDQIMSFTSQINRPSIAVMERIGLTYMDLFQHPSIEKGHPLQTHVLYGLNKSSRDIDKDYR